MEDTEESSSAINMVAFLEIVNAHPYADMDQVFAALRLQGYPMQRLDPLPVVDGPAVVCQDCLSPIPITDAVYCDICKKALCGGEEPHFYTCGKCKKILCALEAYRQKDGTFRCFMCG